MKEHGAHLALLPGSAPAPIENHPITSQLHGTCRGAHIAKRVNRICLPFRWASSNSAIRVKTTITPGYGLVTDVIFLDSRRVPPSAHEDNIPCDQSILPNIDVHEFINDHVRGPGSKASMPHMPGVVTVSGCGSPASAPVHKKERIASSRRSK